MPLLRMVERWLEAGKFRQKAVEALTVSTGFSKRLVEVGLDNAFSVISKTSLKRIPLSPPPRTVLIVCPGNVFTAWLPAAVIALAQGHYVWLKPSVHEPVFPRLWK